LGARERLRFYFRHFNCLELNTSFYNDRPAAAAEGVAAEALPGCAVTVKLHHSLTHQAFPGAASVRAFAACLSPLRATGSLAAVLAQFPQSFTNREPCRRHLAALADALADDRLVVEFRHRSWARDSVLEWLRDLDVSFCCVDEPELPSLMPRLAAVTGPVAYVRLHGRNAVTWYSSSANRDRYDYLYTEAELAYWVRAVRAMHDEADRVFLFTNNCYTGKAVINARMFQKLLQLGEQEAAGAISVPAVHGPDLARLPAP